MQFCYYFALFCLFFSVIKRFKLLSTKILLEFSISVNGNRITLEQNLNLESTYLITIGLLSSDKQSIKLKYFLNIPLDFSILCAKFFWTLTSKLGEILETTEIHPLAPNFK